MTQHRYIVAIDADMEEDLGVQEWIVNWALRRDGGETIATGTVTGNYEEEVIREALLEASEAFHT